MFFLAFWLLNVWYNAATLILTLRIKEESRDSARRVAIVGLILFFTVILGANLIKIFWGRLRFRSMAPPYDMFTRWFSRQSFTTDNEFMSFPSGHTANASIMLMITLLPYIFKNLADKENLLRYLAYIWAILVAFSRVTVGAHFASDVTVGFLLAFLLFNLWCQVFLKKESKEKE